MSALDEYLSSLAFFMNSGRAFREYQSGRRFYADIFKAPLSEEDRLILVVGTAGAGKTSSIDFLAIDLLRQDFVPVFLSLRHYSTNIEDLLDRSLKKFCSSLDVVGFFSESHLRGKKVWLLMDGLDEVPPSLKPQLLSEVNYYSVSEPSAHVVITSRPSVELDQFDGRWVIRRIPEYGNEQVRKALEDGGLPPASLSRFMARPDLISLMRSPLMLQSILEAYRDASDGHLDINKHIMRYTSWRGHTKSLLPSEIPPEYITSALCRLALVLTKKNIVWMAVSEAKEMLRAEFGGEGIMEALEAIEPVQFEGDQLRFRESSYQIAYCAEALLEASSEFGDFRGTINEVLSSSEGAAAIEQMFLNASATERAEILDDCGDAVRAYLGEVLPDEVAVAQGACEAPVDFMEFVETVEAQRRRFDNRRRDILVFAVHGFNTRGGWKNDLSPILGMETDGKRFIYHPWDYGDFKISIVSPWARGSAVKSFRSFYEQVLETYKYKPEVCVVAHSFGTYIVGSALQRFPDVRFDRVLLLGSVLKCGYPWKGLDGRVKKALNIVCRKDFALRVAPLINLGRAGLAGFKRRPIFLKEKIEEGSGHSDLFGRAYMRAVWVPFLRDGKFPQGSC